MVFEDRVTMTVSEPKRKTATGMWRKSDNEKLQNFNSWKNIVRLIKWSRMIRHG
jgi:hypothetical protein